MNAPILIFAIGNPSRGDDALGPLLLRELERWLNSEKVQGDGLVQPFELLEDFQLQIEHAMDMKDRKHVLFIDAGLDTPGPFSFYRLISHQKPVLYSHALAPEALLDVYAQFYKEAPPPAYALCIRGVTFALGEPPSPEALENLELACTFVKNVLRQADQRSWMECVTPPFSASNLP